MRDLFLHYELPFWHMVQVVSVSVWGAEGLGMCSLPLAVEMSQWLFWPLCSASLLCPALPKVTRRGVTFHVSKGTGRREKGAKLNIISVLRLQCNRHV